MQGTSYSLHVSNHLDDNPDVIPNIKEKKLKFREMLVNKLISKVRIQPKNFWLQRPI